MTSSNIAEYSLNSLIELDSSSSLLKVANFYDSSDRVVETYKALAGTSVGDPCLGISIVFDSVTGNKVSERTFLAIWNSQMESLGIIPIEDIFLSNNILAPDLVAGSVVGSMSADGGVHSISYAVTSGGSNFAIENGTDLVSAISLPQANYAVTVEATDSLGQTFSKAFTVQVASYINEKSLIFDGVDEYVDMGDNHNYDIANAFSVSMWVKPDNIASTKILFSKAGSAPNVNGYMVRHNATTGALFAQLRSASNRSVTFDKSLTAGVWQHVVITYAGGSNINGLHAYVDNSKSSTPSSGTLSGTWLEGQNFYLGQRNGSFEYTGSMDEVSIWDKELTEAEVSEIYNSGSPGNLNVHSASTNLQSWYRMGDDDTFPTITDNVGSIDGTMVNMESEDIQEDIP